MSNVVEFPGVARLRAQLEESYEKLEDGYTKLEEGYNLMQSLEDKVETIQKNYNVLLQAYAEKVGTEKIPTHFLAFASQIVVNLETGEVVLGVLDDGGSNE